MQITSYLETYTGLSRTALFGSKPALVAIAQDGNGVISFPVWSVPNLAPPTAAQITAALAAPPPLVELAQQLSGEAGGVCAKITAQVIPDQVHRDAYNNAATIVWANGGVAPTTDPAKTAFAAQAASAGIADPATFAKVVTAVSLASMQLSTILATLQGAVAAAKTAGDLTTALSAFQKSLSDFIASLNSAGLTVTTTPDFRSHAWRKLALNCAGAVSALVLKPAGIAAREPIADIMRSLVRECIAVGRAEGAILDDDWVETVVQRYRDGPADAINSLHADRLAGRRIEIDARNGAVARLGRRHGIATPVNTMIVALLQAASADD